MTTAYRETVLARTPTRWTDDLVKVAGSRWMRAALDRSSWRTLGEAYVHRGRFSAEMMMMMTSSTSILCKLIIDILLCNVIWRRGLTPCQVSLVSMILGMPCVSREKFEKLLSSKINISLEQVQYPTSLLRQSI
jgi:hypothetical protein